MIKKLLARPYHSFLFLAAVLFAISIFHSEKKVDFLVHDTYYVISTGTIEQFFSLYFCLVWLLYQFTFKILFNHLLIWLHILDSLLIAIFISTSLRGAYYLNSWEYDSINIEIVLLFMLLALQSLYTINLTIGKLKRANHR